MTAQAEAIAPERRASKASIGSRFLMGGLRRFGSTHLGSPRWSGAGEGRPADGNRRNRPSRHLLSCALFTCLLAACPRPLLSSATAQAPSAQPPAGLTDKLGPGDTFEVRVYEEPDLSAKYRVGPDGTIDFPLCGRVKVSDQTTSDVASHLRECLTKYIKRPQVSVFAVEMGGQRKIIVFGLVQKPGTFPYQDRMSVVEAITLAGGFAQFAAQNKVTVIRMTPQGDRKFDVAVQDIGTGKAPNFYLLPGDIIYVPESPI